jgi:hypothetical protein
MRCIVHAPYDIIAARHVQGNRMDAPPRRFERLAIRRDHLRTARGEGFAHRAAYAACPAGHQGHMAREKI